MKSSSLSEWFRARTPGNQTGIQSETMCTDCRTVLSLSMPAAVVTSVEILHNLRRGKKTGFSEHGIRVSLALRQKKTLW